MKEHYDFSDGKRGAVVKTNKERIAIRLDPDIIQWFRLQVKGGGDYQILINDALRKHIKKQEEGALGETFRRVIHEELRAVG